MPAMRRWLMFVVLAVALVVGGQGSVRHIVMSMGVSDGGAAHCLDQKNGAPAQQHGDCCTLCNLSVFAAASAAPAPIFAIAPPVTIRLANFGVAGPRPSWLYKSHQARAPPIFS